MEITANPTLRTILDEKFVKMTLDPSTSVITAKWIGFLNMDNLTKGCGALNNAIQNEKITLHISDQTELKVLTKELQEYIGGVWFEQVEKLGLKKIAILMAEDVFAQIAVNKVNLSAQFRNLSIQSFSSADKCAAWLAE